MLIFIWLFFVLFFYLGVLVILLSHNCTKAEDEVKDAVLVTDGDSEMGQV